MPWPEASSVQLGLGLVSPGTGPRSTAARAEREAQVRQAMELLGADDREILWMLKDLWKTIHPDDDP